MTRIIILFTALALFAGCKSLTTTQGNTPAKQESKSATELSADEIRKEFKKSKESLYSKYNGKELVVSGKVHSKDSGEQAALKFGTAYGVDEFTGIPPIYCQTSEKSPKAFDEIKENSDVKVRGYFFVQDDNEALMLKGCVIDSKAETKETASITETLDAETLAREYAKSKTDFMNKYYGKELTVKGKLDVANIRDSPDQVSYTDIKAGSIDETNLPYVTCWVDFQHKKALEPLKTGDAVTMKGRLFITKRLHPGSDTLELVGCDIAGTK
jgi:tRNA_anti-like